MSHPTWVRGLKYDHRPEERDRRGSHPTWVRGLKFLISIGTSFTTTSHPTWVRGLKCNGVVMSTGEQPVAPHVGAWIEISIETGLIVLIIVAPHVGAWIEI